MNQRKNQSALAAALQARLPIILVSISAILLATNFRAVAGRSVASPSTGELHGGAVTPTPSPPPNHIVLVSRLSDARASASNFGGGDLPPPQIQTDYLPASLSNSATWSGESGAGNGHSTSNSSIVVDNSVGTLRVTGDGTATSSAILSDAEGTASAKVIILSFSLINGTYSYSLTGMLSANEFFKSPSRGIATAKLVAESTTIFEVVVEAPAVTLSETGTLPPGTYTFSVEINAVAYGSSDPHIISSDSSANFNFALGPAPTLTPTPTPTAMPSPSATPTPTGTPVAVTVALPIASLDVSVPIGTVIGRPVTTTNVTVAEDYRRFSADFTFDSAVVDFSTPFAIADGLTATGWTVSSQYVAIGPGTMKTIYVRAVANDGVPPLNGAGTLFRLRMVRMSDTVGASTPLNWIYINFYNSHFDAYQPHPVNGGVTISGPTPTPIPATHALNLSTRLRVGPGNDVGIGGFIITGNSPKQVLLRGIGPSLGSAGVANSLADPLLELHGEAGFVTITNNNWRDTQEAKIVATGIVPDDDLESAILAILGPGAYTAVLSDNNHGTGVGLVEIYDLGEANDSSLGNISTRALVGTGSDVVIAGFILSGGTNDDAVLLRGLGPSLIASGVSNALANPTLELRNSEGAVIAMNDDWQSEPPVSLPPSDPSESAIERTLVPGAYTALLSGVNNGTGVGLVEVYDRGPQ